MMRAQAIPRENVEEARALAPHLLDPADGVHVRLLSIDTWRELDPLTVMAWAALRGSYGIPTLESVELLMRLINGRRAIEIGAGHGDFAYHLGIPATDSCIQQRPDVAALYRAQGQEPIVYPPTTEQLDAAEAVAKYEPQVVLGSWVTQLYVEGLDNEHSDAFAYGINEIALLATPCVETYAVIGNLGPHGAKRARLLPHETLRMPGLLSRSPRPDDDRLFLWETEDFRHETQTPTNAKEN